MKLLMHTCCAPCSVYCVDSLRADGIEPTAYFFNPNIHPYTEYKARKDALSAYADATGLALLVEDQYGLRPFIHHVADDIDGRCNYCYSVRLEQTARYAAANGYDFFTTTLLISPYQNHDLLIHLGKQAAIEFGVGFFYRDFRPGFREGQAKARDLGLYMQKYCGCIFSEEERYLKKPR